MSGTLKAVLCEGFTTLVGKPATGPSQKTYHNTSGGLALKAYLKVQVKQAALYSDCAPTVLPLIVLSVCSDRALSVL